MNEKIEHLLRMQKEYDEAIEFYIKTLIFSNPAAISVALVAMAGSISNIKDPANNFDTSFLYFFLLGTISSVFMYTSRLWLHNSCLKVARGEIEVSEKMANRHALFSTLSTLATLLFFLFGTYGAIANFTQF